MKNNAFKKWHRNWQPIMIQLIALMGYNGKWLMITLQLSCLFAGKS